MNCLDLNLWKSLIKFDTVVLHFGQFLNSIFHLNWFLSLNINFQILKISWSLEHLSNFINFQLRILLDEAFKPSLIFLKFLPPGFKDIGKRNLLTYFLLLVLLEIFQCLFFRRNHSLPSGRYIIDTVVHFKLSCTVV